RPLRKSSGHRLYTARDIEIIREIKDMVHIQGLKLSGVKKRLFGKTSAKLIDAQTSAADEETKKLLHEIHKELSAILKE
ncbi:MAG: MerR family transcriptional regulator, partial [Elusimicrobia bacterium]|nr:MerR family transcriptional regulator [Elusimicrobiota bacterium]